MYVTSHRSPMFMSLCTYYQYSCHFAPITTTVEPLSNDHPHQRPSPLYDHISCDGQRFLFVRSLTDDHSSNATNDKVRWNFLPRGGPLQVGLVYFQESRVALQHPFPMVDYYNVALRQLWCISIALNFFYFGDATTTFSDRRTLHRYNVASQSALPL